MELEGYLHGDCHIFAQALHEVFGYKMKLAIDECDIELEEPVLVHAFCYEGNHVFDARGVSDASETLEPFDYSEVVFREVEKEDVDRMIEDGFLHRADKGQFDKLVFYLKEHKEIFRTNRVK